MHIIIKLTLIAGCSSWLAVMPAYAQTTSYTVVPGQTPAASSEPYLLPPGADPSGVYLYHDSTVPSPAYSSSGQGGSNVGIEIPAEMHIQANGRHYIVPQRRLFADPIEVMDTFDYLVPRQNAFSARGTLALDPAYNRPLPTLKRVGASPTQRAEARDARLRQNRRQTETVYVRPQPQAQSPVVQQQTPPRQVIESVPPQTSSQNVPAFTPGAAPRQPARNAQTGQTAAPTPAPTTTRTTTSDPNPTSAAAAAQVQNAQPVMPNFVPQGTAGTRRIQ